MTNEFSRVWILILVATAIILFCFLCVCVQGCNNTDKKNRRDRRKKKYKDSGAEDEVDDAVVGFGFYKGFWGNQDEGFWGHGFLFFEKIGDVIEDFDGVGDDGGCNGSDDGNGGDDGRDYGRRN